MQTTHISILIFRRILLQRCLFLVVFIALFSSCSTSSRFSSTSSNNYEPALLAQSQLSLDTFSSLALTPASLPLPTTTSTTAPTLSSSLSATSDPAKQSASKPSNRQDKSRVPNIPATQTMESTRNALYTQFPILNPWHFQGDGDEKQEGSILLACGIILLIAFCLFVIAYAFVVLLFYATLGGIWGSGDLIIGLIAVILILGLSVAIYFLVRKLIRLWSHS